MSLNNGQSPQSPNSVAPKIRASASTQSPRLSLFREAGGRVGARGKGASESNQNKPGDWPPKKLRLPDTIAAIEAGRQEQRELFDEQPDDSRQGRLARLTKGHRHG